MARTKLELHEAARPLNLVFWGLVLCLVDVPLIVPVEGVWLLVDLCPDVLGLLLMLWGCRQLRELLEDEAFTFEVETARQLFVIGLVPAVVFVFLLELPAWQPIPQWSLATLLTYAVVGYDALLIAGVVLLCLAARRFCQTVGRDDVAGAWGMSALLLLTNVLGPVLLGATVLIGTLLWVGHWGLAAGTEPRVVLAAGQASPLVALLGVPHVQRLLPVGLVLIPIALWGLGHFAASVTALRRDASHPIALQLWRQPSFVWRGTLTLYLITLVLGGALCWSYAYHRKQPSLFEMLQQMMAEQSGQPTGSFWGRWLQTGREQVQLPRPAPRLSGSGRGAPPGGWQHDLSASQLALRETAEAQLILNSHCGVENEQTGWERVRRTAVTGPFRDYEERRYLSRLLLDKFVRDQDDARTLAVFREHAVRVAQDQRANFEDHWYAGAAELLSGNLDAAEKYLTLAETQWPARDTSYGNVYLYVMMARAVRGRTGRVFMDLEHFRENHAGWLYTETYLPDLDEVEKVFPKAPLLQLIRGRLLYFVLDYAGASRAWKAALASGRLDGRSQQQVRRWLVEVKEERQP